MDQNFFLILLGMAIFGVMATMGYMLWEDGPGFIEQDERAAEAAFTKFVNREIQKARAGAINADQWAKDLVTAWSAHNGKNRSK